MSTAIEIVAGNLYSSHQALRESVIDLTPEEYLVCPTKGAEYPFLVLVPRGSRRSRSAVGDGGVPPQTGMSIGRLYRPLRRA